MEWEECGQNSNWAEHPFFKNMFWLHAQENTKKRMHIPSCINVFIFPHVLGSCGTFWIMDPSFMGDTHAVEPLCVFILHVLVVSSVCMSRKSILGAME